MNITNKKVAIIYDWLDSWGGVERVLLELHHLFPQAIFYTSYYDAQKAKWADSLDISTSFIQQFPLFLKRNRIFSLPLFPYVFESFDLSSYDLVISVSSAFSKAVITKPGTKHICYLLTPPRYLWGMTENYLGSSTHFSKLKNSVSAPLLNQLRTFDYLTSQRPDHILSISHHVQSRCSKYYRRNSDVLYPPFDIDYWRNIRTNIQHVRRPLEQDYYLVVSRLEPYKNVLLPIKAFNRNKKKLVVIGKGREKLSLMRQAASNIIFLEDLTDEELALWYTYSKALIMPQEEDFGFVSLEAQIMGCPIISYAKSGASETFISGETGFTFDVQTEGALQQALERFEQTSYNGKHTLQSNEPFLETFSKEQFLRKFKLHLSHIL